jgi:hypothetical protein
MTDAFEVFWPMTNSNGNRVSLSPGDWIKVVLFMLVQSAALISVGVDMRERLVVVETQLKNREDGFFELREEINELRKEMAALRK